MGDKQQQKRKIVMITSSFSGPFVQLNDKTIAIDIIQLHVGEIELFHYYLFEIGEIVEIDEVMKKEEEEKEDEEEEENVKKEEIEEEEEHEEKELYMGDLPINLNNINLQECADFMMSLIHV